MWSAAHLPAEQRSTLTTSCPRHDTIHGKCISPNGRISLKRGPVHVGHMPASRRLFSRTGLDLAVS